MERKTLLFPKRVLGVSVAMGLMLGGASSVSWAAVPANMLVIGKAADPQTLDPAVTIDNNDWTVTYPAYQRLIKYKTENGKSTTDVEGDLAESWTVSPDQTTWTFKLKSGNHFDDDTEVDAAAVKWSFDRLMKIGQGPSEAFPKGLTLTVLDPMTIQFRMDKPFAPFLYTLANDGASIINPIAGKQNPQDEGKAWLSEHTAGSGAYKLDRWQKGQQLVLVPNPAFHGKKPEFKRVNIKIIGESANRRLQLTHGDLDIAESLPVEQLKTMQSEGKVSVLNYPSLRVTYLYLNNAKAPLDQIPLRQAISESVDYQGMIKGILNGQAQQMRGAIPNGLWGYDPSVKQYAQDLAAAKNSLEKVRNKPATLSFLYSDNDPNWEAIALSVQASLAKQGIQVKLEKLANATLRDRVGHGNYEIAIGNWSPDFADPYMFMNYWFESDKKGLPGNRSYYSNPTVDELLKAAVATTVQAERTKLYQQAQKIVVDEAAYVYLFQKNYQVAMNPKLKGFTFNPMLEQVFNIADMHKE